MLNILEKKQNTSNYIPLDTYKKKEVLNIRTEENNKIQDKLGLNEYNNIIYHTPSSKEWSSSIYSYNKGYIKSLISLDALVNNLLKSYFNMIEYKIKLPFKRRRTNKSRYSADKIYVSNSELKHTNTKLTIILYVYNKQKLSIQQNIIKIIKIKLINKILGEKGLKKVITYKNRILTTMKKAYFMHKKWNNFFVKKSTNYLQEIVSLKRRHRKSYNMPLHSFILSKKCSKLKEIFFETTKRINFNILKFNNLFLNYKNLGIISIIEKIYGKKIEIKLILLKSLHLNSDVFSSAVALKLRDRKNKAVRVLRKAILNIVRIPDLHTIRTFDDRMESINKNNILNVIKLQVVSGVRFEASGRLTRRLTAMRAIFKYRYMGSLKNLRSALNSKPSNILRGCLKSNGQYTIINSKTRNGSFGLKGWVSSH